MADQKPPDEPRARGPSIFARMSASTRKSRMSRASSMGGRASSSYSVHKSRGSKGGRPVLRFQPTYQLQPKPHGVFDKLKCERIIKDLIDHKLANYEYTERGAARLCCNLSEELKNRVREEGLDRYKIVAMVFMGEKKLQRIKSYARFLWDAEFDNYATYTFDTPNFYIVGTVFACYYD